MKDVIIVMVTVLITTLLLTAGFAAGRSSLVDNSINIPSMPENGLK